MKEQELSPEERRLVSIFRALGSPARYRIFRYLAQCRQCIVAELVRQTPLAQATVSQHVKVLREAGLICGEIEGQAICYCLDRDALLWLREQLDDMLQYPGLSLCGSTDDAVPSK